MEDYEAEEVIFGQAEEEGMPAARRCCAAARQRRSASRCSAVRAQRSEPLERGLACRRSRDSTDLAAIVGAKKEGHLNTIAPSARLGELPRDDSRLPKKYGIGITNATPRQFGPRDPGDRLAQG